MSPKFSNLFAVCRILSLGSFKFLLILCFLLLIRFINQLSVILCRPQLLLSNLSIYFFLSRSLILPLSLFSSFSLGLFCNYFLTFHLEQFIVFTFSLYRYIRLYLFLCFEVLMFIVLIIITFQILCNYNFDYSFDLRYFIGRKL